MRPNAGTVTMRHSADPFSKKPASWSPGRVVAALGLLLLAATLALAPLQHIALAVALALPIASPVFGLYWAVLSVSVQDAARLPGGLSYTQGAALLMLFGWGLRVLAHPERRVVFGRLAWPWAALLLALLLATSLSPYSALEGLKEMYRWATALAVYLVAVNTLRRPWHFAGLLACLLLGPLANALFGLSQFVAGDGPPTFRIAAGSPFVRAYGTFGQPNSFAGSMNLAWPIALALAVGATAALWRRARSGRDLGAIELAGRAALALSLWATTGVLLAALGASFSRGAWLGAAVGLLGMLLALGRWGARAGVAALIGGGLALALGAARLLPDALAARLASITRSLALFDPSGVPVTDENFAVVERMAQIWAGWRMFLSRPLTGVGPGSFATAYQDFAVAPWFASRGHAHNYYLHIAAEAGVVGLAAYAALIGAVCVTAALALRRANGTFWHSAVVGSCGMIAAVAGHNMFENLHVLHLSVQMAAVWGLLAALSGNWERRGKGPPASPPLPE